MGPTDRSKPKAEGAARLRKNALHRAQCVLRDAPRLHRIAPQHDGMLLMTLRKCLILRCLAKRGLEGRTTFFQPCGILAQPLRFSALRSRPFRNRIEFRHEWTHWRECHQEDREQRDADE